MNKKVNIPGAKGSKRRGDETNEQKFRNGYSGIKWGRDSDVGAAAPTPDNDGGDMSQSDSGKSQTPT